MSAEEVRSPDDQVAESSSGFFCKEDGNREDTLEQTIDSLLASLIKDVNIRIVFIAGVSGAGKSNIIKQVKAPKFNAVFSSDLIREFCDDESQFFVDVPSNSPRTRQKLISGVYRSALGNNSNQVIKMEHSALQGPDSHWNLEVKYKLRDSKASPKRWVNIWNFYPDAKVDLKHNEIELSISSPNEHHEFAVFGTPEIEDEKRMQMAIFGGKPIQGKHWHVFVTLFDDTMMAFKRVCEREERKGRRLLTTLAGLVVSNSADDIKFNITALEEGWKIIGSRLMTVKSKDAWNSPENSIDFPYCVFEIAHVDETKQSFFCGIQASHLNDTAETELVAFFEQEQENEVHLNSQNSISLPERSKTIKNDQKRSNKTTPSSQIQDNIKDIALKIKKGFSTIIVGTGGGKSSFANFRLEVDLVKDCLRLLKEDMLSFYKLASAYNLDNPGLCDLLVLHWIQEQTEAFVSLLMLVFFVGCLTGTRFDPPNPLKEEETDGNVLLSWKESGLTDQF